MARLAAWAAFDADRGRRGSIGGSEGRGEARSSACEFRVGSAAVQEAALDSVRRCTSTRTGEMVGLWACGLVTFQRALAAARQDKNGEPTRTAVSRAPEPADSSNQARQGPENWRRLPTGPSRVDPHPQPPPASILRRQGTWFLKSEFTDETKTWTTSTSLMAMDISDYEIPCAMIFPFSLLQIQPAS